MSSNNSFINNQLEKINEFSEFLSLVGLILSIQSTQIEKKNNEKTRCLSDKIIKVSVFIAATANFIDLSTAKAAYDELINSKEPVSELELSAACDLLTSRVFSTLAAIYLIRATLKSTNGTLEGLVSPTGLT